MVAWVRRKDKNEQFQTSAFQDASAPPMTPELFKACEKAVHVVTKEGKMLRAGKATLFVLERIGWGWFARVCTYPPLIWLVELDYWIFAHSRPFFALFIFRREHDD